MGLLPVFLYSVKKTQSMKKAAALMLQCTLSCNNDYGKIIARGEQQTKAFKKLYKVMKAMPSLSCILDKYNTNEIELENIASRVFQSGYSFANNGDFIPVAVISFARPLAYVLANKDKILNYSYKEVCEVIDAAFPLL